MKIVYNMLECSLSKTGHNIKSSNDRIGIKSNDWDLIKARRQTEWVRRLAFVFMFFIAYRIHRLIVSDIELREATIALS